MQSAVFRPLAVGYQISIVVFSYFQKCFRNIIPVLTFLNAVYGDLLKSANGCILIG
ncbi:hypothetical protein SAMN05192529_11724 [Arachidicoccus rhizosphaerae]|uniref:Uncharacterized protein n=1 Tax=Arachidicoccus rhizosphaerae TaxID=551991 RepID=A0A1H4AY69_9BACT|nr:hypothetical protein SAMN05192529_11724 [Arachidicoccus rhizosphaerae]